MTDSLQFNPISKDDRTRPAQLRYFAKHTNPEFYWISTVTGRPTLASIDSRLNKVSQYCDNLNPRESIFREFMQFNRPTADEMVGECLQMIKHNTKAYSATKFINDKRWKFSRIEIEEGEFKLNDHLGAFLGRWINEQLPRAFLTARTIEGELPPNLRAYTLQEALQTVAGLSSGAINNQVLGLNMINLIMQQQWNLNTMDPEEIIKYASAFKESLDAISDYCKEKL